MKRPCGITDMRQIGTYLELCVYNYAVYVYNYATYVYNYAVYVCTSDAYRT